MSSGDGVILRAERLIALREYALQTPQESESHPSPSGGIAGRRRGSGHDFYDLRYYETGDDPRHIDAAATARSGKRQIRRFHEEVDRTALLVADFRSPMFWGTKRALRSVAAAEALAILGWRHVDHLAKTGLITLLDEDLHYLPPAPRATQMFKIITQLETLHHHASQSVNTRSTMPLSRGLEKIAQISRRGGMVELASGFDNLGDGFASAIERLSHRTRLRILNILDASQIHPPGGLIPYFDGKETKWGTFQKWHKPENFSKLQVDFFALNASSEPSAWSAEISRDS